MTDDTKLTVGFLHVIVLEIDTVGTYNVTKAVYEQYFKVHINSSVHVLIAKQSPKSFFYLSLSCVWLFLQPQWSRYWERETERSLKSVSLSLSLFLFLGCSYKCRIMKESLWTSQQHCTTMAEPCRLVHVSPRSQASCVQNLLLTVRYASLISRPSSAPVLDHL